MLPMLLAKWKNDLNSISNLSKKNTTNLKFIC